jgi:hypothetical protein
MKEMTTIKISKETKLKLSKLGDKSDTYEQIILRLMKGGNKK